MRMRVLLEPHHGASYDQILALAQATVRTPLRQRLKARHCPGQSESGHKFSAPNLCCPAISGLFLRIFAAHLVVAHNGPVRTLWRSSLIPVPVNTEYIHYEGRYGPRRPVAIHL